MIEEKNVNWIINTPSGGAHPAMDEVRMRRHAVIRGIPITTTIDGLRAAIHGLGGTAGNEADGSVQPAGISPAFAQAEVAAN